jgi:superfamily II DNA or RNA helicase
MPTHLFDRLPEPRDYQEKAIVRATQVINGEWPGIDRELYKAGTGSGKTLTQLHILNRNPGGIQITQSPDIAQGFGKWLGIGKGGTDRAQLESAGIFTVQRLKGLLAEARIDISRFSYANVDEAHHAVDETHEIVDAYLKGRRGSGTFTVLGHTATDYRGTPQETKRLHDWFRGRIYTVISEKEAVERGFVALPTFDIWPLVDDEQIALRGGEFHVRAVESATRDKLQYLAEKTVTSFWSAKDSLWDRPTMVTLSSVELVESFVKWIAHYAGEDAVSAVIGRTTLRQEIFKRVVDRKTLLVQIKAVGEGTDLPLRRLIDASPTTSPVYWRQRIGRIMRPLGCKCSQCLTTLPRPCYIKGLLATEDQTCPKCMFKGFLHPEAAPEYIGTNHNFMRHGYLFQGLVPRAAFIAARAAWGDSYTPSRRSVGRVVGLDGLGRFLPVEVPLKTGGNVLTFQLAVPRGDEYEEIAVVLDPAEETPIYAKRVIPTQIDSETGFKVRNYSGNPQWQRIPELPEFEGASSIKAGILTPAQGNWWKRSAAQYGLDPEAKIDSRKFQLLPVLTQIGHRFK